ncbi:MAG: ectonucleotide pyrophosphatase/phosphodiesterase [Luminiphilus sp.]|nr:ectonucleotide pyrophosphatase/phosphodiesterase [Luminiphilus sp.]
MLVSIDGFRWDFLDRPEASNMSAIASRGTRVTKLRTVYPSKTFPAHLSIATGLYPTGHGVVDNSFCRSDRPDCYRMGRGREDPSWLSGTPLWTLVEQQGGRASTFFWPESDASIAGTLPTDYRLYDGRVPHGKRVTQVVEWLSLPEATRPKLVTLYFSTVDSAGHTFGPESRETRAAIAEIDEQIARLWRSIESLNANDDAQISLLLVSDHGMAEVDPETFIDTNDLPRPKGFKPMNGSTRVTYYQRDPEADLAALARDLDELADGRFWRVKPDALAERHFVDHPAVGQIIIETAPPRVFRRGGGTRADLRGMHGYPYDAEDMAAFLVAVGPGFQSGLVIPEAHQLDVYPVAARLLALEAPDNLASDGGHLIRALRPH